MYKSVSTLINLDSKRTASFIVVKGITTEVWNKVYFKMVIPSLWDLSSIRFKLE